MKGKKLMLEEEEEEPEAELEAEQEAKLDLEAQLESRKEELLCLKKNHEQVLGPFGWRCPGVNSGFFRGSNEALPPARGRYLCSVVKPQRGVLAFTGSPPTEWLWKLPH